MLKNPLFEIFIKDELQKARREHMLAIAGKVYQKIQPRKSFKVRCKRCKGCLLQQDCGQCVDCKDKPRFGGQGTRKQQCKKRQCRNPTYPEILSSMWKQDCDAYSIETATPETHKIIPLHLLSPDILKLTTSMYC